MVDTIYMKVEEVEKMADDFQRYAENLEKVSKALEMLLNKLRATAFMGLVGGMAVERYLAWLKPQIDNMAAYCAEVSRDLRTAVTLYLNANKQGSARFY